MITTCLILEIGPVATSPDGGAVVGGLPLGTTDVLQDAARRAARTIGMQIRPAVDRAMPPMMDPPRGTDMEERKTGRGERICTVMSDAGVVTQFVRVKRSDVGERSA